MPKFTITESRLNELISESIDEVLMESLEDEGKLGDFARGVYNKAKGGLQKAGQYLKDKGVAGAAADLYYGARYGLQNAQKKWEAAKLYQRAKNVDFDPMKPYEDKYGKEFADKMRAQRGDNYGINRYNKMAQVWNGDTGPNSNDNAQAPVAGATAQSAPAAGSKPVSNVQPMAIPKGGNVQPTQRTQTAKPRAKKAAPKA